MIETLELVNKLSGVSLATLLAIILWANWRDHWCWSRDRNAVTADRDEWKALAMTNLGIAKQAVRNASQTQSGSASLGG